MLLADLSVQMACGFQRREEREERNESEGCWGQNNLGASETLHFAYDTVGKYTLRTCFISSDFQWQ